MVISVSEEQGVLRMSGFLGKNRIRVLFKYLFKHFYVKLRYEQRHREYEIFERRTIVGTQKILFFYILLFYKVSQSFIDVLLVYVK